MNDFKTCLRRRIAGVAGVIVAQTVLGSAEGGVPGEEEGVGPGTGRAAPGRGLAVSGAGGGWLGGGGHFSVG